jgi:hypothetical protein
MRTNTKSDGHAALTEKHHQHYVEVATYSIAESKGFIDGCDLENWLAAEAELDRLLVEG